MSGSTEDLARQVDELRHRLEEAEQTLQAIRSGEVDALLVETSAGPNVFTLEGAEYSYRVFVQEMQQGAMLLSPNGIILHCNQQVARMLDLQLERLLGASIRSLVIPASHAMLDSLLERGQAGAVRDEILFSVAGQTLAVLFAIGPLKDAQGRLTGCIVTLTDISDLKKAEEALQEADRRKDEFLAMLSHELRNPLAPIRNAVDVLMLRGVDQPEVKWASDIINRQVQQMIHLIDDLLEVSRITRGKIKLQKRTVELATVVAEAVETSRPLIVSRRHQLDVKLPKDAIWIEADPVRFAQVVANLLNNAAKYTPDGGQICVSADHDGTELTLRVRDNGIGIDAEFLPRVFDLFIQGEQSMARSQGGLGIGLSLVKSLIELHGGSVRAHSAGRGQGSEFCVRLPLAIQPQTDSTARASNAQSSGPQHRVLVVEDQPQVAETLEMLLREMGHDVRIAHTGPAAIELVRTFHPAVVLLDLGLPEMDGYEVARRLRAQTGANKPLLVALTGYGQQEDRERSLEAGFDFHLLKPIGYSALEAVLSSEAALRNKRDAK